MTQLQAQEELDEILQSIESVKHEEAAYATRISVLNDHNSRRLSKLESELHKHPRWRINGYHPRV